MTITADRTVTKLGPDDALREMAAVIRTVFGVGLQASRQATATPSAHVDAPQAQTVAAAPRSPAAPMIPMPTSIPLPEAPASHEAPTDVTPETPTPYDAEAPVLRVVPAPLASIDDVPLEQRQALLQEVAFLDD